MAEQEPPHDDPESEPRGYGIRLNGFGSVTLLLGTRTARSILRGAHGLLFGDGERLQLDEDSIVADIRFAERTGLLRNEARPRLESRPADPREDEWEEATPLVSLAQAWVAVELVDVNGRPIEGVPFEIRVARGRVIPGRTDANGRGHIDGIPIDDCVVSFPELGDEDWSRA
jgi:hypothetical protein